MFLFTMFGDTIKQFPILFFKLKYCTISMVSLTEFVVDITNVAMSCYIILIDAHCFVHSLDDDTSSRRSSYLC